MSFLIGLEFNERHGAGVTRYRVNQRHRDAGYFECVAVDGVEGTHHFLGSIQVFSRRDIESKVARFSGDDRDDDPPPQCKVCGTEGGNHVYGCPRMPCPECGEPFGLHKLDPKGYYCETCENYTMHQPQPRSSTPSSK